MRHWLIYAIIGACLAMAVWGAASARAEDLPAHGSFPLDPPMSKISCVDGAQTIAGICPANGWRNYESDVVAHLLCMSGDIVADLKNCPPVSVVPPKADWHLIVHGWKSDTIVWDGLEQGECEHIARMLMGKWSADPGDARNHALFYSTRLHDGRDLTIHEVFEDARCER